MLAQEVLGLQISTLLIGDFNYILNHSDSQGGRPFQATRDIKEFLNFDHHTGLIDLGYKRPNYT